MKESRPEGSSERSLRSDLIDPLQLVTEAALAYLDLDDLLAELLERISSIMGSDTAAILLVEDDRETLAARAAKGLEEEVQRGFRLPIGAGFAGRVAATREPIVIEDVERSPIEIVNPLLRERGIRSLLGVPLVVEGRLVGIMHIGTFTPRVFSEEDVGLLRLVADRCALAIDHARLYEAEHRQRVRAEALHQIGETALNQLELGELLNELLDRITKLIGTDTAAILLVDEEGANLAARAAKGLEEEVERGFQLPIGAGFAGRVAATREPIVIEDVEHSPIEIVNPVLRERGIRSLLGVPLVVDGRLIGVLHVGTLTQRAFSRDDVELLQLVAERAAQAIDHDLLVGQRRIAEELQAKLLPRKLPKVPGMQFAAQYLPAAEHAAVGGDWYDILSFADGRLGLAVGDVVGNGVNAAAMMGEVRSAVRAYALEARDPADAISRTARFFNQPGEAGMATVILGALDSAAARVTFARAGHPHPLLVAPNTSSEFLRLPGGPLIGSGYQGAYAESTAELPSGSTLLLYTDGLIERRGRLLREGEAELVAAAADGEIDPHALLARVLDRLAPDGTTSDDIALLAVQNQSTDGTSGRE
jgi:GAF domain-containing protein